jgi:hypothetical protein
VNASSCKNNRKRLRECLLSFPRNGLIDLFVFQLQVIESKEYQMISGNQLAELFASDDLNVNTEEDVFRAMEKWVQYDCEKRKSFVSLLLENIRLPLMSCKLLTDRIEKSPVFALSDCRNELLLEAMKYHLLPERRAQMQSSRTKPRKSNVGLLYVVGGKCSRKKLHHIFLKAKFQKLLLHY